MNARVLLWVSVFAVAGGSHANNADATIASEPSEAASARGIDIDAFSFALEPARIVVGDTSEATVIITAVDDDSTPLDVAPPRLMAQTGTIGAPERTAPGKWRARFVPPTDAFPHVAIVSATIERAEQTVTGFIAIPLWGKGQTTINTKPGSGVVVVVGKDSFGPIAADASGDARVPIVVPPGPEHAVAKSTDAAGNESQKTVDLGVPAFNRLAVRALDDTVAGDGKSEARVVVFLVDKKGAPMIEAPLVTKASVGEVLPTQALAPGVFLLRWRPGAVREQDATLDVALDGAPLSRAVTALRVISGRPQQAAISLPRRSVTADENPELVVRMSVSDSGGNPISFKAARVDVDFGRIDKDTGSDTVHQVTWVVPRERKDRQTARLFVRGVDGQVLGKSEVTLLPGKPARLSIDRIAAITADGSEGATVVVRAEDAYGNAVIPQGADITVPDGKLAAKNLDVTGKQLRALYVPTPREDDETVTIVATLPVGDAVLEAQAPLHLRPKPRALLLVGPAVGSSWSYGDVLAVGPELSMLVRIPVLDGGLHAGLNLGWHEGISGAGTAAFTQHRTFPLLAELSWRPLIIAEFGFHLGLSGGVVVADVIDATQVRARAIEPALAGAATLGVAVKVGPGYLELDGRVGASQSLSPQLVQAMPFGAGVVLGYRFGL